MSSSLGASILGAAQASLSVLLVISYGVAAGQFDLLDGKGAKEINKICVRMFMPALLITNVGSQLHLENALSFVPVLIWALTYTLSSMAVGFVATRVFKLPAWVTPAVCFNNITSLPLLLIQSLDATGILKSLLRSDSDTTAAAVSRAESYFLVCAIVGNCLTFALGPRLLDDEEVSEEARDTKKQNSEREGQDDDIERGSQQDGQGNDRASVNEETSLLPDVLLPGDAGRRGYEAGKEEWDRMPQWIRSSLQFLYSFINPPLVGAAIGIVIGLVPPLHTAFFSEQQDGGFFKGWLTTSLQNIGGLFATLQTVVVGVKLSSSLRKMKRGEDSGQVPWPATTFVLAVRFVIWPIISIGVIYLVASRTNWLADDPVLWFVLMLLPTGPTAMKLAALADLGDAPESGKLSIAKFLTISYGTSPLIAFAVVGSLKTSEAILRGKQ